MIPTIRRAPVVLMAGLMFLIIPSLAVQADEIDDMVMGLNNTLVKQDWSGFGDKFREYSSYESRYQDTDFVALGKRATTAITNFSTVGTYLSHSVIQKDLCGDRLARVVSVFFSSEGQYFLTYWFFRPQEKWALAKFNGKGEGHAGPFVTKLEEVLKVSC